MKYLITHSLIFFATVALLSVSTGCRLNGPFYHPSAWQFYNPFKGDSQSEYADNAFDELPGEPKSQPPESMAKLDSPSVATPAGGYGNVINSRVTAYSTTQSNASINVDTKDKNAIGVQDGMFANRSTSASVGESIHSAYPGATPSVTTQTPNVIARNSNDQPWNLPANTSKQNTGFASSPGFASTTPTQQIASAQPTTSIPGYNSPTNAMPMESLSSTVPMTGTIYPAQGMEMQAMVPQQQPVTQQPLVQQPAMQQPLTQQPATAPVYNGYNMNPSTTQYPYYETSGQQATGFQATPIPEQSNPSYTSGFTSFAPNTTDSYRPGTY